MTRDYSETLQEDFVSIVIASGWSWLTAYAWWVDVLILLVIFQLVSVKFPVRAK